MSSYIIECKNQDALDLIPDNLRGDQQNGLWTTNIQERIILEEGDIVSMKSVFIDTQATSEQKIVIADDLDLELEYIYYLNNTSFIQTAYTTSTSGTLNEISGAYDLDPKVNDGFTYIMTTQHPANVNAKELGLDLPFTPVSRQGGQSFGGFTLFCNYTDLLGNPKTQSVHLNKKDANGSFVELQGFKGVLFDSTQLIEIRAEDKDNGAILITNQNNTRDTFANTKFGIPPLGSTINFPAGFEANSVDTAPINEAVVGTTKITVEAGNYDPNELCESINRELGKVGKTVSTSDFADNDFLFTNLISSGKVFTNPIGTIGTTYPSPDNVGKNDYRFKIDQAGAGTEATPTITGTFIGASEINLEFDPATSKFFWEYTFTPPFKGTQEAVGYFKGTFTNDDLSTGSNLTLQTSYSGIAFTSLKSFKKGTTEPANFWDITLGFDIDPFTRDKLGRHTTTPNPNCILTRYFSQLNSLTNKRVQYFKPVIEPALQIGTQISGKYQGLDTAVNKTRADPPSFPYLPTFLTENIGTDLPNFFLSTSDKTTPIEAKSSILQGRDVVDFAYYLIEVKASFANNFITPDNNREQVVGIVSRYYFKDSYTSGEGSDSLIYQHVGEPALLSSFRCRILDANKNLAQNIGKDSTIFLQVEKAPKQLDKNIKK